MARLAAGARTMPSHIGRRTREHDRGTGENPAKRRLRLAPPDPDEPHDASGGPRLQTPAPVHPQTARTAATQRTFGHRLAATELRPPKQLLWGLGRNTVPRTLDFGDAADETPSADPQRPFAAEDSKIDSIITVSKSDATMWRALGSVPGLAPWLSSAEIRLTRLRVEVGSFEVEGCAGKSFATSDEDLLASLRKRQWSARWQVLETHELRIATPPPRAPASPEPRSPVPYHPALSPFAPVPSGSPPRPPATPPPRPAPALEAARFYGGGAGATRAAGADSAADDPRDADAGLAGGDDSDSQGLALPGADRTGRSIGGERMAVDAPTPAAGAGGREGHSCTTSEWAEVNASTYLRLVRAVGCRNSSRCAQLSPRASPPPPLPSSLSLSFSSLLSFARSCPRSRSLAFPLRLALSHHAASHR
jgi:hypothetical protein